jgi:uncharacterized membrane protein YjjP (DUF1212 family)
MLIAGIVRIRSYLASNRPTQTGYLAIALISVGLAMLTNVPAIFRWLDDNVWHTPDAAALSGYLLTTIGAWAAVELVAELIGLARSRQRNARLGALLVVDVAMTVAFAAAAPTVETAKFFERYAGSSSLLGLWLVFLLSLTNQLIFVSTMTLRYTRHDDLWLSRGLTSIGIGAALCAVFTISKLASLAAHPPGWLDTTTIIVLVSGVVLVAGGALLPQLGPELDYRRDRRRLAGLWHAVTAAYPYVRTSRRQPGLYRTVIEIQDAVAEARVRGELNQPVLRAVDRLDLQPGEQFDQAVTELHAIAKHHLRQRRSSATTPPDDQSEPRGPIAARVLTELTSPTLLAPALLITVSIGLTVRGHPTALAWGASAAIFVGAIPLAFLRLGVRHGRWDDHHVQQRRSRRLPLAVASVSVTTGLILLAVGGAPDQLLALVGAMLAGLTAVLTISHWWKISIHTAVAGGTAVVLGTAFAAIGAVIGLAVLAGAGWARLASRSHTLPQVLVGAITGAAAAAAIYVPLR